MSRPFHIEINNKIRQARKAASENRISILSSLSTAADALALGFGIEDISHVLLDILKEITPNDYARYYHPQRSYEEGILQCELFSYPMDKQAIGLQGIFEVCL
jgi:hypothetical protein